MKDKNFGNPAALAAFARGDIENALVASTPGGIEAQEKRGQMSLVASSDMPKTMRPDQAAFEKVGFKFGEPIDELFVSAQLPSGWKRAPTDHSMHSEIMDEQGRRRVSIFYKAAFYDRRADAGLVARFQIHYQRAENDMARYVVEDAGNELFRTAEFGDRNWDADKVQREVAQKWLKDKFPNAGDPTAYW